MAETSAPFVWGDGGSKVDPAARRRRIAEAMMLRGTDTSPIQHWTQGLNRVAQALIGGYESGQADRMEKAGQAASAADIALSLGGASPSPVAAAASPAAAPSMAGGGASRTFSISPEVKDGIVQTASALGIDPVDLATTISYETGGTFDPTKPGPTTKWGRHRGLIQFGEPQAKQHGVDWNNPVASQLGPNGAVASYLKAAGVTPGMGLLDIYSAINAGAPGLYNRSDAAAGGAPGTVRDKVEKQMGGHRAKAQAIFAQADAPAPGASPVGMETGQDGFVIPPAPVQSIEGDDPAKLRADAQVYAQSNPEAARQLLARADAAEAASATAAPQPIPAPSQVAAAPEMTGRTFDAITSGEKPLDPVFQTEGVAQPWMGTALPPQPAQVAQAPMPPPRPADLRADLPAPGAVPAIGQAHQRQTMPDLTSAENAGALAFAVQEGERRNNQPSASQEAGNPFSRVVQALTGQGQPQAAYAQAPSPAVTKVAQAVDAAPAAASAPSPAVDRVAAAMRVLNNPYAQPGHRAIAQSIVQQSIRDPQDVELKRLSVEKARREAENAPLDAEGRRLDVESKKKALGKVEAPNVQRIKQPDGSEVAVQWDLNTGRWVPLEAPDGGNAVGSKQANPYAPTGKTTDEQAKSSGYANRMVDGHSIINDLEGVGTSKWEAVKGAVPIISNSLVSNDKQKLLQAQRNFVNALLRRESGAVISDSEFDSAAKQYFPQPGDSPEVIAQKRANRETTIQGVMGAAGPSYKVPETYKPGSKAGAVDTSKPGSFKFNPATGKMEPM